jgi:hypothetical protein
MQSDKHVCVCIYHGHYVAHIPQRKIQDTISYNTVVYDTKLSMGLQEGIDVQASTDMSSGTGVVSLTAAGADFCSKPICTVLPSRTTTGSVPSGVTRMTLRARSNFVEIDVSNWFCGIRVLAGGHVLPKSV